MYHVFYEYLCYHRMIDCEWSWLTNQLVSVTMVWSSLSCKDKHGRLLMVLSHTHLVHDACRFVALHTYAKWDIHVYNIASIIPSHQSNFSMYASIISNDSTIIYSGALLFSPWFLLSHTTLLHLIPHAGHITESVVVASLGELLPQTSMEVRKKRLYLGVSSHEDLIFIEICKHNYNCAIIFAVHTHI